MVEKIVSLYHLECFFEQSYGRVFCHFPEPGLKLDPVEAGVSEGLKLGL